MALAAWRVARTWSVFSQTWDEPAHLAAGMEWLDRGTYQLDPLHPPLARVLAAAGPYLAGIRSQGYSNAWQEGNAILHKGDVYRHTLVLMRAGILVFLTVAAAVVYWWTRRLYGTGAAVVGVALLTTLPAVLGHSGLATTDMAIAATLPLALGAWWVWLGRPTIGAGLALGTAVGVAVLSKLSALVFFPVGALALLLCHVRSDPASRPASPSRLTSARFAYASVLLLVWAGYRFSVGPLATMADAPAAREAAARAPKGSLYARAYRLAEAPIYPAAELFQGVAMLRRKNREGQKGYLLGEIRTTGWWYYYPVALAVKTPLAFLLLVGVGVVGVWCERDAGRRWSRAGPLLAAAAILLAAMPSRVNIGSRHVLPLYVMLAIPAAGGVTALCRPRRYPRAGTIIGMLLVAWQFQASFAAAPDYAAYFNELALVSKEPILVDADLDNGQDLLRLADTLQAWRPSPLWIAYAGSADLTRHHLPPYRPLPPHQPVTGWIAISLYDLKLGPVGATTTDDFSWLEAWRPIATVGKSILIYRIVDGSGSLRGDAGTHSE